MIVFLLIPAGLCLLYLLAVMGRRNHHGLSRLRGWNYAHRGLHDDTRPENSMAAFRAALENGYGMELDVHLLSDGNLAVMHDSALKRTTGAEGTIENLVTGQLADYRLGGTDETIPQFREVLELVNGKVPLIIELKATGGNYAALTEAVCKMLETYPGDYCLESFDPLCIFWLRRHRPDIIRGQLTEDYFQLNAPMPGILKWVLKKQVLNFLTLPDFVAYRFEHRQTVSNTLVRKVWGVQGVAWTLRSKSDYDTAVQEGWIPIFENFRP